MGVLATFTIFLVCCTLAMYQYVIMGAKIEYGDGFSRQIYVFNPVKNETESINDDGTFVIKNGTLVGRIRLEDAKIIETKRVKASLEPALLFYARYLFLLLGMLALIFLLVFLIMISMYFCFHAIDSVKSNRIISQERAARNAAIMRMMNCLPYSAFMISESRDCPICLQEFTQKC